MTEHDENQTRRQRTFDVAVRGLLKQGAYSVTPEGACRYRGPDGLKCAVGHLIPDDKYDPAFEGYSVKKGGEGIEIELDTLITDLGYALKTASDIQNIHDTLSDVETPWPDFVATLKAYAAENNLDWPGDE